MKGENLKCQKITYPFLRIKSSKQEETGTHGFIMLIYFINVFSLIRNLNRAIESLSTIKLICQINTRQVLFTINLLIKGYNIP